MHTQADPEWTITPGMVECLMGWPRESKPGASFKNNIYLLQLAEQWRKLPLRWDFAFAEHFVINTISPDDFWGQDLFVFPIRRQGGSGGKEMPCFQLCRAHADRTLACWNGSAFFSCLLCLGSYLHARPLLDSLGPDSLLASLGYISIVPLKEENNVLAYVISTHHVPWSPVLWNVMQVVWARLG